MYKLLSSLNLCQTFTNLNCVAHLSVHDGVQCFRRAELLKVGESQRGSAIFNGAGKARSMLMLISIEHELLHSLDFTDTIEEFALAKPYIS